MKRQKPKTRFQTTLRVATVALAALAVLHVFSGRELTAGENTRYITSTSGLNVRELPDVNSAKKFIVPYKAQVELVYATGPVISIAGTSGQWTMIRYGGNSGWVFGGFLSRVAPGTKIKAPVISITSPAAGWTAEKVVQVAGTVASDEDMHEVRFIFNGNARFIPLQNGRFDQKIVLGAGANYIKIEAENSGGVSAASLKLVTNNSSMDVKVILAWDTDHTDVDLWVTDPAGEKVYYGNRHSKLGGTLDVDITTGYGPETFTQPRAVPGSYLVQVQYYGGAQPTMAQVTVILYEGTPREKRHIFPALLHETGSGITIGKFQVD